MQRLIPAFAVLAAVAAAWAADTPTADLPRVERIFHRSGQTFILWKEAPRDPQRMATVVKPYWPPEYRDLKRRYNVYRHAEPITDANLATARLMIRALWGNSAIDHHACIFTPWKGKGLPPGLVIEDLGTPLGLNRGLGVVTVPDGGKHFYAVVAADADGKPTGKVVPNVNAPALGVDEQPAPIAPVQLAAFHKFRIDAPRQPMVVTLHASSARAFKLTTRRGNLYQFFATDDMHYMPGQSTRFLIDLYGYGRRTRYRLRMHEGLLHPAEPRIRETWWYGLAASFGRPWVTRDAEAAVPYTERRVLWMLEWVLKTYPVDPARVYLTGGSMGGWGCSTFGLRHPELFAAINARQPRPCQRSIPGGSLVPKKQEAHVKTVEGVPYGQRMDMIRYVREYKGDLPPFIFRCGRKDGFAPWRDVVEFARAMLAARQYVCFVWTNEGHTVMSAAGAQQSRYAPFSLFRMDAGYPAFTGCSADDKLGDGRPDDGDLKGQINLGLMWQNRTDEPTEYALRLYNARTKQTVTADVTLRRRQQFKPAPGTKLQYAVATVGTDEPLGEGTVTVDAAGRITVPKVKIPPADGCLLSISAR
jgi:hypothetical protein